MNIIFYVIYLLSDITPNISNIVQIHIEIHDSLTPNILNIIELGSENAPISVNIRVNNEIIKVIKYNNINNLFLCSIFNC